MVALCITYPQIHLFQDVDTVVIKPKDMVVLTQEYQELATNSFVLHAYYNYRQLLLSSIMIRIKRFTIWVYRAFIMTERRELPTYLDLKALKMGNPDW